MNTLIKFIISGGTAAFVDLIILNFLDSLHLHYLLSVNIAFIIAFFVSFSFQKFWTFSDSKIGKIHHQMMIYFLVSVLNVGINNLLIYIIIKSDLVQDVSFLKQIVIAQIISSIIIAIESFIIYRFFIFKKNNDINKEKMNILIVTQKLDINDSYFGFFHDWVLRFSNNCNKVTVIALEVGKYDLPTNVKVLSLNKGHKFSSLLLLWKHSINQRKNYDVVFCHMSPIYVMSGWLSWLVLNKKISLWYVHRSVDLKLRIATILSDIIFTATKESFLIKSNKVKYMGQAVDINRFSKPKDLIKKDNEKLKLITVGRITKIKNIDVLINAIEIIKNKGIGVTLQIIGAPLYPNDFEYKKTLEKMILDKSLQDNINFLGPIANTEIPKLYWENDICINLAPTGGLDKTVLEAMAASMPIVVVNKAFESHLGDFKKDLLCNEGDYNDIANKIISIKENNRFEEIGKVMNIRANKVSSLDNLISSIVINLRSL